MPVKVVDASAAAALLFGEPQAQQAAARLQVSRLVSPALPPFEVASICVKKIKRRPEQRAMLLDALRLLGRLAIEYLEVDIHAVTVLAETAKLTAYDASYLWLARNLGAELVTLDRKLELAAKS